MTVHNFNFALARIASAQLCRAAGIDRCTPAAIDCLADIFGRFMMLLASAAADAAAVDGREEALLEDVVLALGKTGLVLPRPGGPNIDADIGGENIRAFLQWLRGPMPERAARTTHSQKQTLSALGAAQGAAIAAQGSMKSSLQSSMKEKSESAHNDWLQQLANKQLLMSHDPRFRHTALSTHVDEEPAVILGGPESLEDFYELYAAKKHQHLD